MYFRERLTLRGADNYTKLVQDFRGSASFYYYSYVCYDQKDDHTRQVISTIDRRHVTITFKKSGNTVFMR